ncbi:protein madd-4 isoform X1 [Musca domestica]|uniref:Protein madd-4 isoform X1 n=1 Tax=Musca domestica TaxID=7370 RepID=A0ABM3V5V5_MUSDO|nr:protein madd-4 isoform X1 [Musca domestica]
MLMSNSRHVTRTTMLQSNMASKHQIPPSFNHSSMSATKIKRCKYFHWINRINRVSTASLWTIVLVLIVCLSTTVQAAKILNASEAFDNTWSTATDLENELECVSSQQKRSVKGSSSSSSSGGSNSGSGNSGGSGGWTTWSEWSTCSRTCDGGVMQQIRRCQNANGCKGDSVRYRICNMQPCPEKIDFRAQQCAANNDVPYDGTLYKWTPHYDYVEPCALTCRGRPAHLADDESPEPTADDSEHYDELSVVVQLSPRVLDGTRCRSGSLDMCIQGKCQRVGCDLKIGSAKKVDICGVCGGNGSSCSQSLYQWETVPMSLCSVSCGGGYKMSRVVCRSRVSGTEVEDALCNAANRPEPSVELCNTHTCPPRWIADDWSPCHRPCGPGIRTRMVVCAEENNGLKTRVADSLCPLPKPPTQEQCIIAECPKWEVEKWSSCSESCGQGIQMRNVECKSADGGLSAKCDPLTKPSSVQQCTTGISCESAPGNVGGGTIIVGSSGPRDPLNVDEEDEDIVDEDEDEEDDTSEMEDDGDDASYNDQPVYAHHTMSRLHQEEPDGPRMMRLQSSSRYRSAEARPSEPTYIKDIEWSPCSVTCGEGIRRRSYRCKIFLEFSRTLATINDTMCEGVKPHDEVERCVEEPCMLPSHGYDDQYPRDSIKVGVSEPGKTYVWREQGYTSCSASCLGGVEELIINCVREDNGRVVSPFLCAPETKPEARVRTCNDRPCPPRWNYSDYTPCSKSCGIGIKTREVQCIHEVTRGGENTMVVPNSMCPQPPPADRQYCNVLDCPVRWEVGEWSKCSHTCGYGYKERKVECKQIMAQEHKIERPESMCPSAKPPDKKPCNVKPCPPEDPKPIIQISNTTHIQHDPKKSKITLKVGGAGVVFFGTQVKIKCPVKRYNRTKIKWNKDHKPLVKSRKFKVSKKGALRILDITFRDAGVYSCHAGLSSAEITIDVKAKPGQRPEDLERHESDRLVREKSGTEPLTAADMTAAENNTQTTRRKQQQNARERNRRPKSDGIQQHADSSIMGDEHSHLVQQAQDGLPQPSASSGSSRRTNALLAMPYFQALLSNLQYFWSTFQKFGNSRGHHMLSDRGLQYGLDVDQEDEPLKIVSHITTKDLQTPLNANKAYTKPGNRNNGNEVGAHDDGDGDDDDDASVDGVDNVDDMVDQTADTATNATDNERQSTLHLPHARWPNHWSDIPPSHMTSTNTVTYKWLTSPWTPCSQKCGAAGSGLRRRTITCIRIHLTNIPNLHNGEEDNENLLGMEATTEETNEPLEQEEEVVDNAFCEDYGLDIPDTFETCGSEECPRWTKGEWSLCHQSRCFGRNTAIQRREVSCRFANDTVSRLCPEFEKPISRQECYNERCKGVWRVEPWSECNAPCGRQGIKYRILQCVWYGTRRPAGNACKHQNRPAVMKVCKSPPCYAKAIERCKDTSRYCRNVRSMGLCRLQRYQEKCCKSCKYNSIPN